MSTPHQPCPECGIIPAYKQRNEQNLCSKCRKRLLNRTLVPSPEAAERKKQATKLRNSRPEVKAEQSRKSFIWSLPRKYGITEQDYNNMFSAQAGCCAICGIHQMECKRRLCVDHCHDTGKVRGLLCSDCNVAIGLLKDSPDTVARALKYLTD